MSIGVLRCEEWRGLLFACVKRAVEGARGVIKLPLKIKFRCLWSPRMPSGHSGARPLDGRRPALSGDPPVSQKLSRRLAKVL